jgi:hypothetical protein
MEYVKLNGGTVILDGIIIKYESGVISIATAP